MPIAYIYGGDVYIHDWIFDRWDKSVTKTRVVAKILQHKVKMGQAEANNGGEEFSDDVYRILKQEYGYSINMSHKKAPTNMAKLTRIEQHAPTIRNFYFRDSNSHDDDYRRAMSELTSFSFTAKNLHDDAPDSLAMLAGYISERPEGGYRGEEAVLIVNIDNYVKLWYNICTKCRRADIRRGRKRLFLFLIGVIYVTSQYRFAK